MSFDTLVWVRTQKTGSPVRRAVLRVLADHAGQDHSCYLRTSLIAEETEFSESSIRKALIDLVDDGHIRVFERYHPNGARRSNRYQLLVDGADTLPPEHEDWARMRQPRHDTPLQEPGSPPLQEPEGGAPGDGGGTLQEPEGFPSTEVTLFEGTSKKAAAPRATRIPDDFYPSSGMQAWFREERLHEVIADPRGEHESFCDYWRAKAGADARKVDWPATWRNWMRRAAKNTSRPYRGTAAAYRPTTDDKVQHGLDLVEQFRQMEETK